MDNYFTEDDLAFWVERRFRDCPGYKENITRRLNGNSARSSDSVSLPRLRPLNIPSAPQPNLPSGPPETDAGRTARLLQEKEKSKEKTAKKRIKKQKQRERKRLEKQKKNPQSAEGGNKSQLSKAEGSQRDDKPTKDDTNSSVPHLTSSRDTDSSDSSDEESSEEGSEPGSESGDSEELDLTSSFVSKAAVIAKRKLEQQNPRPERREQKKNPPVKEETRRAPDKSNEDQDDGVKKTTAALNTLALEDNLRISTELATLGNKFASTGQFDTAVKYFTDAIKYNPTEYKLFGNRSFCFEKMQEYEKAVTDAELSLNMCPGWVKGLYRKGRALAGLKRYDEAAQAFKEVLKLDSSCADAAQELMQVQIIQVMAHGYTRPQSSNALIIHGTVDKALEELYKLNSRPVENINRTSPLPSASPNPRPPPPPPAQDVPFRTVTSGPDPSYPHNKDHPPHHRVSLFPIWVGNLVPTVTSEMVTNLFSSVGEVFSVKLLAARRCAFVNFTHQEHCDEAIRKFNGDTLKGTRIVVRYPDRIPHNMGMAKTALKADYLQQIENKIRQGEPFERKNPRPGRPVRYFPQADPTQ